ncbi:NUMOD4 motif-containing HNH endonuclease [Mycobacterium gordonae]|uniref:NUMOD4 motif-containing HNH endonuclease n=1 Tax=Mycobacterium gordonae TaxID=1778 RepID=UPI0009F41DFF
MTSNHQSNERWLPACGWEGIYEVSDKGRVRSIGRTVHSSDGRTYALCGQYLRQFPMKKGTGHLFVRLSRPGIQPQTKSVHRLVLTAFAGPGPDGTECCHFDGDPTNNCIENLYWGTRSQNMQDRFRHGWKVTAPTRARIERNGPDRCSNGHEMTPDNSRPGKPGHFPRCRRCHVEYQRAYRARKRIESSTGMAVSA